MPSFLPISTQQRRPRLVCELRSGGIVVGRADELSGLLAQVASAPLMLGSLLPSLRAGNVVARADVVSALRTALGKVSERSRDVTLILPDAAVRVLLLDFDSLPNKVADAMPILRFRLSRLLPFNAETAMVSYQVMGTKQGIVQVLVVATPREVLDEYESVVREAGYEPGSVLPSTLAICGAVHATEPVLIVNADENSITTAIVRRGDVLLHRMLDLYPHVETVAGEGGEAVLVTTEVDVQLELQQAISVAIAYFEDVIGVAPKEIYAAGSRAGELVSDAALELELQVCDVLAGADLMPTASGVRIERSLLAGLRGATAL
ncbi:MAG: hypothetical protein JSS87_03315 [Acidobacteria bacterium]|nr:hypothetical protein [Acidobacteriota bacterium]